VDGGAKVLGALRSPLWFETVMATAAMIAAAPSPISRVPVPTSCADFTPAGLPGAKARSAAKAEEPTIAATVTAATTLLKPCIGFPRCLMADTCPKPSAKSTSLSQFLFDCCQKALPHRSRLFFCRISGAWRPPSKGIRPAMKPNSHTGLFGLVEEFMLRARIFDWGWTRFREVPSAFGPSRTC